MKKIILIASLLMVGGLWANGSDKVCSISYGERDIFPYASERINKAFVKDNILRVSMVYRVETTEFISSYCRYDREITIIEIRKPDGFYNEFSCVLNDNIKRYYQ